MPKTKSQKGNDYQNYCEKVILESFPKAAVHNQKSVAKLIKTKNYKTGQLEDRWISQRNDILGCIDLVVFWGHPSAWPSFIQCTTDSGIGRKIEDLKPVPWAWDSVKVEIWIKRPKGHSDLYYVTPEFKAVKYAQIIKRKFTPVEHDF